MIFQTGATQVSLCFHLVKKNKAVRMIPNSNFPEDLKMLPHITSFAMGGGARRGVKEMMIFAISLYSMTLY